MKNSAQERARNAQEIFNQVPDSIQKCVRNGKNALKLFSTRNKK